MHVTFGCTWTNVPSLLFFFYPPFDALFFTTFHFTIQWDTWSLLHFDLFCTENLSGAELQLEAGRIKKTNHFTAFSPELAFSLPLSINFLGHYLYLYCSVFVTGFKLKLIEVISIACLTGNVGGVRWQHTKMLGGFFGQNYRDWNVQEQNAE